jgi:hypothetical protein
MYATVTKGVVTEGGIVLPGQPPGGMSGRGVVLPGQPPSGVSGEIVTDGVVTDGVVTDGVVTGGDEGALTGRDCLS